LISISDTISYNSMTVWNSGNLLICVQACKKT